MIDFHAHILPGVDDGSKSIEESILMLNSLAEQNVITVIATPHFYANDESVDTFVARRNAAYQRLMDCLPNAPNIVLGAEVRYYDGISHLQDLKNLRIEGTRFLLLEMPFHRWTEYAEKEIIDIACRGKVTLVLAHIERYLPFIDKEVLVRLHHNGVLFQVNASFFEGFFQSSRAIRMLKEDLIQFVGSDCHNMQDRKPNIQKATQAIQKKIGNIAFADFIELGNILFRQNQL